MFEQKLIGKYTETERYPVLANSLKSRFTYRKPLHTKLPVAAYDPEELHISTCLSLENMAVQM